MEESLKNYIDNSDVSASKLLQDAIKEHKSNTDDELYTVEKQIEENEALLEELQEEQEEVKNELEALKERREELQEEQNQNYEQVISETERLYFDSEVFTAKRWNQMSMCNNVNIEGETIIEITDECISSRSIVDFRKDTIAADVKEMLRKNGFEEIDSEAREFAQNNLTTEEKNNIRNELKAEGY